MIEIFIIFFSVFITTYLGVEIFRRFSLKKSLFDLPNERSSHQKPTPVGGGAVIVCITLSAYLFFLTINNEKLPVSYLIGSFLIALISFIDDLRSIAIGWRFTIHSIAALLAIWGLGCWDKIYIPFAGTFDFGLVGAFLTFGWIVWLTNAFNFMDGIDGIAATQAFTAGLGWFIVSILMGFEEFGVFGGIIAFSSLGFLIHNWQPAKIFMGDVGSAFLGYTFAVLPFLVKAENDFQFSEVLPIIACVLVSVFLIDSVSTFIKRLLKGQKVWQAHREHFYQRLVLGGYSHQKVTLIYGFVSIVVNLILIFWIKFYWL